LVKAMFERAAWGSKLFCCWCAQDIEANYFWESLGFVPLAFRAGSRGKGRIHIFWQRRIREGDTTTPYWFPSQTSSGSIREDRLVFPIPPGMHWKDQMPRVLPETTHAAAPALPEEKKKRVAKLPATPKPAITTLGRLSFAPVVQPKPAKAKREPRKKIKNDPKFAAATRELCDRWLERVNEDPSVLIASGKYEVSRALQEHASEEHESIPRISITPAGALPAPLAA
jgi:hypothetical protein